MTSFREIIRSADNVLIDFHAEWCGPCKTLAPILKNLKSKRGEDLKLIKIDIDKNPRLAQTLYVQSVPTLIFYKSGKLRWRRSGVLPLSELERALDH